jgi:hypothetical protein
MRRKELTGFLELRDEALRIRDFQVWLNRTGRGHLHADLGNWEPGAALLEVFRRAGVRGISHTDSMADTLPMARDIIAIRVKSRASGVSEQA